jgi:hypothetical protein
LLTTIENKNGQYQEIENRQKQLKLKNVFQEWNILTCTFPVDSHSHLLYDIVFDEAIGAVVLRRQTFWNLEDADMHSWNWVDAPLRAIRRIVRWVLGAQVGAIVYGTGRGNLALQATWLLNRVIELLVNNLTST